MMQPNAKACVNEHVAKLFSVQKLQIQPVTDLGKSYKLLMAYSQLQIMYVIWPPW